MLPAKREGSWVRREDLQLEGLDPSLPAQVDQACHHLGPNPHLPMATKKGRLPAHRVLTSRAAFRGRPPNWPRAALDLSDRADFLAAFLSRQACLRAKPPPPLCCAVHRPGCRKMGRFAAHLQVRSRTSPSHRGLPTSPREESHAPRWTRRILCERGPRLPTTDSRAREREIDFFRAGEFRLPGRNNCFDAADYFSFIDLKFFFRAKEFRERNFFGNMFLS